MAPHEMSTPHATPELAAEVDAWAKKLSQKVVHEAGLIPARVDYDNVCCGVCEASPKLNLGNFLAENFSAFFLRAQVTEVYLFHGEGGELGTQCQLSMIARRSYRADRKGQASFVFVSLQPESSDHRHEGGGQLPMEGLFQICE